MTYAEKLRDPRWQRRRLEVMSAAGFKCELCGNEREELHIHHIGYRGEPWEAPMELLECLCATHHREIETQGCIVHKLGFKNGPGRRSAHVRDFMAEVAAFATKKHGGDLVSATEELRKLIGE